MNFIQCVDGFYHANNPKIIFHQQTYNNFLEICEIYNIEKIESHDDRISFNFCHPYELFTINYFYTCNMYRIYSLCIPGIYMNDCHELLFVKICYKYPQLLNNKHTLQLLQLHNNNYTHKHEIHKLIKISIQEYEYLNAMCNVYGFYGCHYSDQSIKLLQKNLVFKITKSSYILINEHIFKRSRKPKHNGFVEIFNYLDKEFPELKLIISQKIVQSLNE